MNPTPERAAAHDPEACSIDDSAELLTLAMRAAHAGHWALDLRTNEAYWSPEYAELIGVPLDTPPSYDNWLAAVHPEDRERADAAVKDAIAARRDVDIEFRVVLADGAPRWIAARGRIHVDARNAPLRLLGVSFDVTARKRAAESLRSREAQLGLALDAAQLGAWDLDLATRTVACTPVCRAHMGLPPDVALTYETLLDAIHPDDRADVRATIQDAIAKQRPYRMEYRTGTAKEARWITASGYTLAGEEGSPIRLVGVTTDMTERRNVEEELRRRGQEVLAITENLPALVAYVDRERRYRFVNRRHEEWFDLPRDAVQGRTLAEVLGEEAYAAIRPYVDAALAGREVRFETSVPHQGGGLRRVAAHYVPRVGADGTVRGFVALVHDVSERARAEERLRDSEERARARADELVALMDATPAAIWIARDRDCRVITGSRAAHELLRMPVEVNLSLSSAADAPTHFTVRRDGTTLPPELLPLQRAARGEEVRNFEEEVVFADGELLHLYGSAVPLYDADGTSRGAIGAFVDITPLKAAEARLRESEARVRESEERLRLAAEAASVGVWSWDVATDRTHWNPECHTIFGVETFDGTVDAFRRALHPEDATRVWEAVDAAIDSHGPLHVEFRIARPSGEVRWVVNLGRVDYGSDGRVSRVVGIIMDVTDRKRTEEALYDADRRKDEFLAMLAHELRNPLAPIRNAVRLAQRLEPTDPQLPHMHQVIERQAEQLTRIVDDLLDVARVTHGRIALKREKLDVVSIVARAIETSRPLIDAQGHRLAVSMPSDALRVEGDLARLAQVLSNLLNNAAKYTEPGGRIWLEAERHESDVVLRVRDDGIGIPPDLLPRVFDLFMQADRSLHRAQGGFGIGLTLVRRLTELHGGRVDVTSPAGERGSEFVVRLPALAEEARPADGSVAPPSPSAAVATGRRIVVVDDNEDSAESLALLLRSDGHEVHVAHGGDAALATARRLHPDVVLLDIGLPDIDGYEVARRLRADPDAAATTLIAMTGYGQREDRQRTSAAGFDHHLTKPVDYDLLAAMLASC